MSEGSSPPNLMHLAADLLDPDLDLDTGDIPEDLPEPSLEAQNETSARPLGRVGDYEFVSRFQGSDMTDVFLANKSSKFGFVRRAVVKRAKPGSDMYEVSREMLLDEAKALAWLEHPNIVPILDFGEDQGGFYLAMEHVNGTDLRYVNMALRKRREALPLEIAAFLAIEVLRGLHHAHTVVDPDGQSLEIVHRDVNPTNVLISTSGHVKLTDFGVVRMRDRLQEKTQPGIVKGKFSYMAREYILGRKCDCRVDIYAVGIMLLEMLTGRACFSKLSVHEVMKRVVEHDLPLHRMEAQNIPTRLNKIVNKATAKNPDDRYKTANDMANELETWLMRSEGHASPWIVSAFLEQHELFRRRSISVVEQTAAEQSPGPVDAQTSPAAMETTEKTSELLVDIVSDDEEGARTSVIEANDDFSATEESSVLEASEVDDLATQVSSFPPEAETQNSGEPIKLQPVGEVDLPQLSEDELIELTPRNSIDPEQEWLGSLGETSVAEVLEALIRKKACGAVSFENRSLRKQIFVRSGACVAIKTNVGMEDLSELLIQQKVINRNELDRMMLGRNVSDPELGKRLVNAQKLTPERFAKIHGQQIQSCLEDVLTWREGDFIFTPQSVPEPQVMPHLHIELVLLPHLADPKSAHSSPKNTPAAQTSPSGPRSGGSLAQAIDMARQVTQNRAKGRTDRINSDDES